VARAVAVRCFRLLAVGTAIAGVVLLIVTTQGQPDIWDSFLFNALFLAVPTMMFIAFFGAMAVIAQDPELNGVRVVRDFMIGLAGAFAVPLGVMFVFFQGAITATAGLYFLIGLGTNYLLWRELRTVSARTRTPQPAAIDDTEASQAAA
jgi:hypothetical protein